MENFTIKLLNATGGARLGNKLSANLHINKNDDPIYFTGKSALLDIRMQDMLHWCTSSVKLQSFTPLTFSLALLLITSSIS